MAPPVSFFRGAAFNRRISDELTRAARLPRASELCSTANYSPHSMVNSAGSGRSDSPIFSIGVPTCMKPIS